MVRKNLWVGLYYGTSRWNGTPTPKFLPARGGVRDFCDSGLRCSWLSVFCSVTYIIRRGIKLTPLQSAERVIFKDGGHDGGHLDRFSPLYRYKIHDLPLDGVVVRPARESS